MALARNDSAPLFASAATSTLRLTAYLIIAIVLMIADHRGAYLERIRLSLSVVIEPMYRIAALPAELGRDARTGLADRRRLTEQNADLSRQLMQAQAALNRYASVQEQNLRLQELLNVQRGLGMQVQLAKLIDVDMDDPSRHRIMLNLGSNSQVTVGQAVIDARGLVGQVIKTLPTTSTVLLITDPDHAVPIIIERTGLRTIAYGSRASGTLELPNIPISADVKIGDRLITSGLGGHFPAGFPVGEIRAVSNDASGMFTAALATPSAALDRSGEVLILHQLSDPIGPPAPASVVGPPASLAGEAPATALPVSKP